MKSLITLLTLAISSISYAQPEIIMSEQYRPGKEIYEIEMNGPDNQFHQGYRGQFLNVPLNYKNPAEGNLEVYYRLSPNFDPQKPTVLYFYGGPGGNSWFSSMQNTAKGVNFLYMDQRGTGFSKPQTLEQLQNTDYFTSEYVARDANLILKHLNIKEVSVYGHSYGTVVATIFASFYPQVTKSLIIEGNVYDGAVELWSNSHRRKLLNAFYRDLSDEQKEKIQKFTQRDDVPDFWLSALAQSTMYNKNFQPALVTKLNDFIDKYDQKDADKSAVVREQILLTESKYFSAYFFNHIACKELSRMNPEANFNADLTKDGKFIPHSSTDGKVCLTLKNFTTDKIRDYSAKNYPVKVPTTYFQGTTDGATATPNAVRHYDQAAKGNAQLVLVTNEGHGPMISCLSGGENTCGAAYLDLFMTAVRGEAITQSQLNAATTIESKWAAMQKWK